MLEVERVSDRIVKIMIVVEEEMVNVIRAYNHQWVATWKKNSTEH